MALYVAMFVGGMVGLYFGGNWLVDGSSTISRYFGIRPIVIGLTVVAFGTSAPELVVTIIAATKGTVSVAVGNVIGSNIANIALILGLTSFIRPMAIQPLILKKEYIYALVASVLAWCLSFDGLVGRMDGTILLCGLVLFLALTIRSAVKSRDRDESGQKSTVEISLAKQLMFVGIGLAGLIVGAQLLVEGAVGIARYFGVPELVIGLTVVSLGTSLPELVTSIIGVVKGEDEIAVGNILGSNIFNVFVVLGVAGSIMPLTVEHLAIWRDFPIMVGFTILLFILMRWGLKLTRKDGIVLLSGYAAYILYIYIT